MNEPSQGSQATQASADEQRANLLAQQRFLRERLKSIPSTAQLTRNSSVDRLEVLDEQLARLSEAAE